LSIKAVSALEPDLRGMANVLFVLLKREGEGNVPGVDFFDAYGFPG
jgi:hypothetical protein